MEQKEFWGQKQNFHVCLRKSKGGREQVLGPCLLVAVASCWEKGSGHDLLGHVVDSLICKYRWASWTESGSFILLGVYWNMHAASPEDSQTLLLEPKIHAAGSLLDKAGRLDLSRTWTQAQKLAERDFWWTATALKLKISSLPQSPTNNNWRKQ